MTNITNTKETTEPKEKHKDNQLLEDLNIRDYFAAKALPIFYQYWMNDYYHPDCPDAEIRNADGRDDIDGNMKTLIAEDCYAMADAMMEARK